MKEYPSEAFLSEDEGRLLLTIARDALTEWLDRHTRIDVSRYPLTDSLREKHGAFVTLRRHGELRGCIGYTMCRESLAVATRDNAINAGISDPRFAPLRIDELPEIEIEVSALTSGDSPETPFKRVYDVNEIVIGRDGLYIEQSPMRGGILLPQVAVEHGLSREQFLSAVCRKAGYEDRAWENPETRLYRFSAQVFSEE